MNAGGNGTPNHQKNFVAWNKGKTGVYSAETLNKMRMRRIGKKTSDETKRRISEAKKGSKPVNRKPVLMFNRNGDFVAEFPSIKSAAMYLGVTVMNVSDMLHGKRKTVGGGYDRKAGYTFKYKNENPDR